MIPSQCSVTNSDPYVKVSDKKSTSATFRNSHRDQFILVRYDGCVVENSIGCDWIVIKEDSGLVAVELKGCDVDHAAEQVYATLRFVLDSGIHHKRLAALVICTRYPKVDTKIQRLKLRMAKHFGAPLHIRTDGRDILFEDILKFS